METLLWAMDLALVACLCLWALREDSVGNTRKKITAPESEPGKSKQTRGSDA